MSSGSDAWAQKIDSSSVRISELERIVFHAHPEVIAAIDADKAGAISDAAQRPRKGSGWLWGLLGVIVLFAPITGVAIYGSHRYLDIAPLPATTSIPIAGVCFAITLVAQIVAALIWIRHGALRSVPTLAYGAVTAVLAGFATIGIPQVATEAGVDAGFWYWPIVGAVIVGVVLALAVLLRWQARGSVSRQATGYRLVQQTIGALPASERKKLRLERDAAVRILKERGVLDDIRAQLAAGAELGRLHRLELIWKELDERPQG